MKIIFLDVDGVLNSRDKWGTLSLADPSKSWTQIDPDAVQLLFDIMASTGACIVVSSTWRFAHFDRLVDFLVKSGASPNSIIGATPRLIGGTRGQEINLWLCKHPEVTSFVILDDSSDMEPHMDRLVKTSWQHGLEPVHVQKAIELLGGK